jgi:hypothetical protein
MQRREAQLSREHGRKERRLLELDYLLGVYDGHRLGGLRFRIGDGPFLDDDADLASPPWTSLRELEQASLRLEDDDSNTAESGKWLRLLVAPGRSLGGARPKASVVGMTLLERTDGEAGASYLDLAGILIRHGADPGRDLEQLWRRLVFFICVSNVDDHLRNHGFLLDDDGWLLAPAYDMNPVADVEGLTLNISETDNAQDLSLIRDVARSFRVPARKANEIIAEVVTVVRSWRAVAEQAQLSRAEQERMAPAFRLAT